MVDNKNITIEEKKLVYDSYQDFISLISKPLLKREKQLIKEIDSVLMKKPKKVKSDFDEFSENLAQIYCDHPAVDNTTNRCTQCGKKWYEIEIELENQNNK